MTVNNDLLLPPTGHGHPDGRSGDAAVGVADLGVVGEVADEADGGLGHDSALLGLPGRAVCPALGPGGRWMPWHAKRPPGASRGANRFGPVWIRAAGRWSARVPAWLVGALAAGGRACQDRPARSLHPGRGGRARLSPRGRLAACFRLVHQVESALRVYGLPTGSCDVAQRVNRPLGLPCLLYLVVERVSMAELRGGASTASAVSVTCKPALSAGHFQPSNRGLSAVRTGVSPGRAGPSGAKGCVLTTGLCWMAPSAASPMCEARWRRSARPAATWRSG